MPSVGKTVVQNGRKVFCLRPDVIVKGKKASYRVVGSREFGGFAAIYAVNRIADGLLAVLKMSTDVRKNMLGGERIRRVAWVMRQCAKKSPDLVPHVLDEGEIDGRPFFVMENLNRLGWSSGGFGLPDTEERRKAFFTLLINSVQAVHDAGFVHCDIKPNNIMERPSDHHPLLIDFGSAHPIAETPADLRRAPSGWIDVTRQVGRAWTPGYDADEDMFTVQKDIFALGQVIRDSFGRDVDLAWTEIINACISRRREFRYASLERLRNAVDRVDRRRRSLYWQMRKERIAEQREIERSLSDAQSREVEIQDILRPEDKLSDGQMRVLHVEFPSDERYHYALREPLHLRENTVLLISGKGILEADISGPESSVIVLRNYATLHNLNDDLPPENDLTYVIVGPGSYLNFPNLCAEDYGSFFPNRRRILRDIDATTSFRLDGPHTFSGVEDETLAAIQESKMPDRYKAVLSDFFSGKSFTVMPDTTN